MALVLQNVILICMVHFLRRRFSCLLGENPLRGNSLLLNAKPPVVFGTHLIDRWRTKDWLSHWATQWFLTREPWINYVTPLMLKTLLVFLICKNFGLSNFRQQFKESSLNFTRDIKQIQPNCLTFVPPEIIRKSEVFWWFQGK